MEDQQPTITNLGPQPLVANLRPEKCPCGVASGHMIEEGQSSSFRCNNCKADRNGYIDEHMEGDSEDTEQIECGHCGSTDFQLVRRHLSYINAESEAGNDELEFHTGYEDYELDTEDVECTGCGRNVTDVVSWTTY